MVLFDIRFGNFTASFTHKENILLNGMQNIIMYRRIIENINETRPTRPYLKMFIQFVGSQKLELDFESYIDW